MNLYIHIVAAAIAVCLSLPATGQQVAERAALSVVIVLDASGSMGYKMELARRVASELVNTASPLDEFAIVQASERPVVLSGFADDGQSAQARIASVQARGRSGLLDAIYLAAQVAKAGRNTRKALIVVSDGDENSSRYTSTEVKYSVREAGVRVYAVGVQETDSVAASLSSVIEYGNGRHFVMNRGSNVRDIVMAVSAALRSAP